MFLQNIFLNKTLRSKTTYHQQNQSHAVYIIFSIHACKFYQIKKAPRKSYETIVDVDHGTGNTTKPIWKVIHSCTRKTPHIFIGG